MADKPDTDEAIDGNRLWAFYAKSVKKLIRNQPKTRAELEGEQPPAPKRTKKIAVDPKPVILPTLPPAAKTTAAHGLDGHTRRKLEKGELQIQARLDLHGYTQEQAYAALLAFITESHRNNARLVLVITGKGANAKATDIHETRHTGGVLKSVVPEWLNSAALTRYIVEIQPAARKHGGDGALYVYLKKIKK